MQMHCSTCNKLAEIPDEYKTRIKKAAEVGFVSYQIPCPLCRREIVISVERPDLPLVHNESEVEGYACPRCDDGWIVLVDNDSDETFWGCGDCGDVWFTKEDLDKAVAEDEMD